MSKTTRLIALVLLVTGSTLTAQSEVWIERLTTLQRYRMPTDFDSVRGRVVGFGGWDEFTSLPNNDTLEWDGFEWVQRDPETSPPAGDGHQLIYDAARDRTIVFGGGICQAGETWIWDGHDWELRTGIALPRRFWHAATYDPVRERVVTFGGRGTPGQGYLDQTWEWDGSTWTQMVPTNKPSPREDCAMAWDSVNNRVLFSPIQAGSPVTSCSLLVGGVHVAFPLTTSGAGFAEVALPIPHSNGLIGLTFSNQGLVLDPAGLLGLVSMTNGVSITIGD